MSYFYASNQLECLAGIFRDKLGSNGSVYFLFFIYKIYKVISRKYS